MGIRSLVLVLISILSLSACQKVDPDVFLLNSEKKLPPPIATDPKAGRITAGSSEGIQTGGSYKLKGRVSFVPTHHSEAGPYKLRGSVSF